MRREPKQTPTTSKMNDVDNRNYCPLIIKPYIRKLRIAPALMMSVLWGNIKQWQQTTAINNNSSKTVSTTPTVSALSNLSSRERPVATSKYRESNYCETRHANGSGERDNSTRYTIGTPQNTCREHARERTPQLTRRRTRALP